MFHEHMNHERVSMRKLFLSVCILFSVVAFAQQGSAPAKKGAIHAAPTKAPLTKSEPAAPAKAAVAGNLPTVESVDAYLKTMYGYDSSLVFKVAEVKESPAAGVADATVVVNTPQGQQVMHLFITPDHDNVIMGDIMPFGADPFKGNREKLVGAFGVTQGAKDAPVTIVEFGDMQCPSCRVFQPTMEKLLKEKSNVKLIFQNFPLETMHPWAGRAARYLDCIARKDNEAGVTFLTAVYAHQSDITEENVSEKLNSYAKMSGKDPVAIEACSKQAETDARIKQGLNLGTSVGVNGTPTLFVNGRRLNSVNGMPYEVLKSIVDFSAEQK